MTNLEKMLCLKHALNDGADEWKIENKSPWGLSAWFSEGLESEWYDYPVVKRIYEPVVDDDATEDTGVIWFHDFLDDGTKIHKLVSMVGDIF